MADRNSSNSPETGDALETPDRGFRLAVGGYVGLLVAGVATAAVALADGSSVAVLGTTVSGFLGGCLVGIGFASRVRGLAVRIGQTRARRAAPVLLAAPFGVGAGVSLLASLESPFLLVALAATITVATAGTILRSMAWTRYADAVTDDEPIAAWQWDPPGNPRLDAIVLALWVLLGVGNAVGGNWAGSVVWTGLAALWACSGLAEGRWQVGSVGATPEIRVYRTGLVKQHPCTRSFVPWDDVSHVRLREDELVLDRGLFDVRFDRDELPELEAVLTEIERLLPNGAAETLSRDG